MTGRQSGISLHPRDSDNVIRRYQHTFNTDGASIPSLAWAAVCAARRQDPLRTADPRNEFFLRYGVTRTPVWIDASNVMAMSADEKWSESSILTNRIVVIGGDYSAADEHRTPRQWQLGSEIAAQAIETELAGKRVAPLSPALLIVLQILQGVALLFLFEALSFGRALAISLVCVPIVSLGLSYVSFATFAEWGSSLRYCWP